MSKLNEIKKLKERIEELEFVKDFQKDVFADMEFIIGVDLSKKLLPKTLVDEIALKKTNILKENGYDVDSVIKDGEIVNLKDTANLSTGGTAMDVTDIVHPENIFMAERISKVIGLNICGIDLMTSDISKPVSETGGAVLEVNAGPGFRMHLAPTEGLPRNVAAHVMDMLYPHGSTARIPIVAITGTNGKTTTTRLIAHMVKMMGHKVGYTTSDGIYIQNHMLDKGNLMHGC